MTHTKCAHASFLHVDVGRLEATLVDVVEGEGLSRVGAVFVHLHHSSSSSLRLLLLSSGCHDFRKCESHGNTHTHYLFLSHTHTRACPVGFAQRDSTSAGIRWSCASLWDVQDRIQWLRYWDREPACFPSITIHQQPQYTWGKKGTRYKIKGDVSGDSGILSKPTIRRAVGGGMSHSPVC